ncbi:hypothetical protein KC341_g67 [Hortaea werneckii]|nr:hypothetical protein KC341_g67 [Hortaea werneckii]
MLAPSKRRSPRFLVAEARSDPAKSIMERVAMVTGSVKWRLLRWATGCDGLVRVLTQHEALFAAYRKGSCMVKKIIPGC